MRAAGARRPPQWKSALAVALQDTPRIGMKGLQNWQIVSHVPANKLLKFDVRQGWMPLCNFLNVAVPETPFPHLNERAGLAKT
jgi:hypothetical protein